MNKGFKDNFLIELKSKCDIISVMSQKLKLERKGKNYWTCCPFHHEKTPSLCVNDMEQIFYCYGCKEHGDVITYVQKMESVDFLQAIEILAKSVGMEVPQYSGDDGIKERKKQKDKILKLLRDACLHYEENLYKQSAKIAQEYIKKRGLTKYELDKFHIGYSNGWTEIITFLKQKGYSDEEMKLAGISELGKNSKYFDVFGERLIFPFFNIHDECIGFSARSLVPTNFAKYKNSANTLVFDKGKSIFGINLLKKCKQQGKLDYIVLVEGQMDVIAMHKAGFENAVACLGTAVTEHHAKLLKNLCDNIVICLDGDSAGQKATIRSIDILVDYGFNIKAVCLPNNKDPDDFLKQYGKEKLKQVLDNAVDHIEFKIKNKLKEFDITKIDEKAKFVSSALSIVNTLKTNSEKEVYLGIIKKISGISTETLKKDLTKEDFQKLTNKDSVKVEVVDDAEQRSIKFILASLCFKKEYADYDFDISEYILNPSLKKLYEMLKESNKNKEKFIISTIYDNFDIKSEPNIISVLEFNLDEVKNPDVYYNECKWKLVENKLKDKMKDLTQKYKTCTDSSEKEDIAKQLKMVINRIKDKILEE